MAAVTGLALLVMLVTSFLAVQAVIARRDAERRQKQAENLVAFMLGDLNDKLGEVQRLDIMEAVDNQAMAYFESLPLDDVTDEALAQRARALEEIGNVRLDQGQLPQALTAYHAALKVAEPLAKSNPAVPARQLAYAQMLTYIGTVHWYQGELGGAQASFESARDVLSTVSAMAPGDRQLQFQLAAILNNIGHVLEARASSRMPVPSTGACTRS